MKNILIAATLLAVSQFAASTAQAAVCAERSLVVKRLDTRFGETLQAVSAPRKSAVLEVYMSRQTESWTVLLSFSRGLSCLVASGSGYTTLDARYGPAFKTTLLPPVRTAMLTQPTRLSVPR